MARRDDLKSKIMKLHAIREFGFALQGCKESMKIENVYKMHLMVEQRKKPSTNGRRHLSS